MQFWTLMLDFKASLVTVAMTKSSDSIQSRVMEAHQSSWAEYKLLLAELHWGQHREQQSANSLATLRRDGTIVWKGEMMDLCFSCFHVGNAVPSVYVVTDAFVVTTVNQCGKVGEVCMKTFEVIALNLRKKSDLSAVWKGFNCFSGSSAKISIFRLNFGFEKLVTDICHHFLTFLLTELSVNNENIITCSFNSSLNVSRSFECHSSTAVHSHSQLSEATQSS